jgi:hypothetical protein
VVRKRDCGQMNEQMRNMMNDNINPTYYRKGIETTDYIVSHSMNYLEGNIIKYITRYKDKGGLEDLKKAEWYLTRLKKEYLDEAKDYIQQEYNNE